MTKVEMKMVDQANKTEQFRALHVPGTPLVLFNIWDVGSAKAVAASGAKAIATSSWSVANANGFADGERIPLAVAIQNLRRISRRDMQLNLVAFAIMIRRCVCLRLGP
jgi:2-methylisocitrate lyase-like PEP mutase family enzyme